MNNNNKFEVEVGGVYVFEDFAPRPGVGTCAMIGEVTEPDIYAKTNGLIRYKVLVEVWQGKVLGDSELRYEAGDILYTRPALENDWPTRIRKV
jgi:hypothetical protein